MDNLGSIFADPTAYADPSGWHAAAKQIRDEAPILKVALEGYPEFWAITKHADVMEIERNPAVFTNGTLSVLATQADLAASDSPVKTLIQMDGGEHKSNRGIVNEWFKPRNVTGDAVTYRSAGHPLCRSNGDAWADGVIS